jgi:hypothetical protein
VAERHQLSRSYGAFRSAQLNSDVAVDDDDFSLYCFKAITFIKQENSITREALTRLDDEHMRSLFTSK